MEIELPQHCNFAKFEDLLASSYSKSFRATEVTFSFKELKWISPLQLSILFGWLDSLVRKGLLVIAEVPEVGSSSVSYLSHINFFSHLTKRGIQLPHKMTFANPKTFATFTTFDTVEELHSYENNFVSPNFLYNLLDSNRDLDLIRDGELKDIILHELGENAFHHGGGKCVRFGAFEIPTSETKREHKIITQFSQKSCMECVVSDSGKGIIKALASSMPPDYVPHYKYNVKLPPQVATILYSLEFSSTSNEIQRKARLAKIIEGGADLIDAVPSGLFYCSILAKIYGGQLLVRTSKCIVSVSYGNEGLPEVQYQMNLAAIPGTHVLLRVPISKGHYAKHVKKVEVKSTSPRAQKLQIVNTMSLASVQEASPDNAHFIVATERAIDNLFNKNASKRGHGVFLLGDGFKPDTKTFSLLLMSLSIIPRKESALVLFGLRKDLIETAICQWEEISKEGSDVKPIDKFHGYRSLILASSDFKVIAEFGSNTYSDSTTLAAAGKEQESYLSFSKEQLHSFYVKSCESEIGKLIESSSVKHSDQYYYLIEGKYYTRCFYEIRRLVGSSHGLSLVLAFFKEFVVAKSVRTIFCISNPLFLLCDKLQGMFDFKIEVYKFDKASDLARSRFIDAALSTKKGHKLLLLSDVICTGGNVRKFCHMASSHSTEIELFTFVDSRIQPKKYVVVEHQDSDSPLILNLTAFKRSPIEPLFDLPSDVDPSLVLIVDEKSNSPIFSNKLETTTLSSDKVLEIAMSNKALYQGHFHFQGKHYTDFLYFKRLFHAMFETLHSWWGATLQKLQKEKVKASEIVVIYLDERRGWEQILLDFMSKKQIRGILPLDRSDLDKNKQADVPEGSFLWFVLPVVASGVTLQDSLKFATHLRPKGIHVSVITARMLPSDFAFYRNISGFDGRKVTIDSLSYLPISAHTTDQTCPMCHVLRTVELLKEKVSPCGILNEILQEKVEALRPVAITLDDLEIEKTPSHNPSYLISLIRLKYQKALKSIEARKDLINVILESDASKEAFLITVGLEFTADRYSLDNIKKVTYIYYERLKEFSLQYCRRIDVHGYSFQALLGIHRAFPDVLVEEAKRIVKHASDTNQISILKEMVFLALLAPDLYGSAIIGYKSMNQTQWHDQLVNEIKSYNWYNNSSLIDMYFNLLWLLKRSTAWGSGIERLRSSVQTVKEAEIVTTAKMFIYEGMLPVMRSISHLSKGEASLYNLWSALLIEGADVETTSETLEGLYNQLKEEIAEAQISPARIAQRINSIDVYGKFLTKQLERIFTNPIDIKLLLEPQLAKRWPNSKLQIIISIHPGQPGIFIGLADLKQIIVSIIDNANEEISEMVTVPEELWLEFKFDGPAANQISSELLIRDNLPWSKSLVPSGGMKNVISYCQKYGALYDFNPAKDSDPYVKMRIIYKTYDERERHEHAEDHSG